MIHMNGRTDGREDVNKGTSNKNVKIIFLFCMCIGPRRDEVTGGMEEIA